MIDALCRPSPCHAAAGSAGTSPAPIRLSSTVLFVAPECRRGVSTFVARMAELHFELVDTRGAPPSWTLPSCYGVSEVQVWSRAVSSLCCCRCQFCVYLAVGKLAVHVHRSDSVCCCWLLPLWILLGQLGVSRVIVLRMVLDCELRIAGCGVVSDYVHGQLQTVRVSPSLRE